MEISGSVQENSFEFSEPAHWLREPRAEKVFQGYAGFQSGQTRGRRRLLADSVIRGELKVSENNYVEVLSKIKAAEEEAGRTLAKKKSELDLELETLRAEARSMIETAQKEAALVVESAVRKAKEEAEKEADKMLSDARRQAAEKTEKNVDKRTLKRLIEEILFSEFRE
jgi:vacuolar-type H+-ATPase subunit H